MLKLSIIVPVYNVAPYLKKCLNSLINQTLNDLEIIIVDDGSTDQSLEICQEYEKKDPRIFVVKQSNQGVSSARNRGLELAKGEWIGFVDSDDYLSENAYETLIRQAEGNNCDAAIMDFAYVDKDGHTVKQREYPYGDSILLSRYEAIRHQFDIPLSIRLVMWNKVFKRDVIQGLKYDESLKASEDTLLLHQCLMNSDRVIWVRQPLYYNVQRPGSAMRGGLKMQDYLDSLSVHKMILLNVQQMFPELYDYALIFYIDTCIWKMRAQTPITKSLSKIEKKSAKKCLRQMKKHIRDSYFSILKCNAIPLKKKIAYLIIGIKG